MGAALAGLDLRLRGRWSPAPVAAGGVAALAFVTLVSAGGEGWPSGLTGVPDQVVPLLLDLLFLSAGALLARPGREPLRRVARDTHGGVVLRRLLPLAIGAPLLLSVLGPQADNWLPAAILLALGLLLVAILAREIDVAEERLRRTAALHATAERRHRFSEPAQAPVDGADGGQLPKSVV